MSPDFLGYSVDIVTFPFSYLTLSYFSCHWVAEVEEIIGCLVGLVIPLWTGVDSELVDGLWVGVELLLSTGTPWYPSSWSPEDGSNILSSETMLFTTSPTVNPPSFFSSLSLLLMSHQSNEDIQKEITLMPAHIPTYL